MTKLRPMKAIRKKCLDCCCGQVKEVDTNLDHKIKRKIEKILAFIEKQ